MNTTVEFNKNNWTGELAEMRITSDTTGSTEEFDIELRLNVESSEVMESPVYTVWMADHRYGGPELERRGTVWEIEPGRFYYEELGCKREHEIPLVAVAQVHYNL